MQIAFSYAANTLFVTSIGDCKVNIITVTKIRKNTNHLEQKLLRPALNRYKFHETLRMP